MSTLLVADRFLRIANAWFDVASAARVRLRTIASGTRHEQLEWDSRMSRLARLRHPLMASLVDFGAIDSGRLFEAYLPAHPHAAPGAMGERLLAHVVRFLAAHDLRLHRSEAPFVIRPIVASRIRVPRPLGVVLQPRAASAAALEVLDSGGPAGTCAVRVQGASQSGLRTLRLDVARAARIHGYLPIDPLALRQFPWLAEALADRHVCVLHDQDSDAGDEAAAAIVRLTTAAARRHVMFTFVRSEAPGGGRTVYLERMGAAAMTGMVYLEPESDISPEELLDAALAADGRPGAFLARLAGHAFDGLPHGCSVVHERAQPYVVSTPASVVGVPRDRRTTALATRALGRADTLARQGRHPTAARALERAVRVLRGRGDAHGAADCAARLGWLALDRARIGDALRAFEAAADGAAAATRVSAAVGRGVAWTDAGRLAEAESALRSAVAAAGSLGQPGPLLDAAAALGRCLFWQGRYDEAAALLGETADRPGSIAARSRAAAIVARIHLAEAAIPPAIRAARHAVALAAEAGDARAAASAHRVLALSLLAAGDADGARRQVHDALLDVRRAHLPLAAIRLRLVRLAVLSASPGETEAARRLSLRLRSAAPRLPPLLRFAVRAVCAHASGAELDAESRAFVRSAGLAHPGASLSLARGTPMDDLEALLEIAHRAPDDRQALGTICEALQRRLHAGTVVVVAESPERRTFASAGRPWPGDPEVAWRAVAAARPVPPDSSHEPLEAAEPLRYGGELVAVVACRWVAGTPVDVPRALALLHIGALALAPHVRACLDREPAAPPADGPLDLLGDSAPARTLREAIARAARAPFPVLIEGESGSGKELVACGIHRLGARRERRFCTLNCAALSDDLVEAELFGHVRGAFTGAISDRPGLFEEADGGTLFLDEIGELSARAQAKLLRVLQDGEVRRVGETFSRRVDVRIIAATNRRLRQEASEGRFRGDLRFRLDVIRIDVPALRDRAADVPMLASHFWTEAARRVGSQATLTPDALAALARYDWPGNVRELQNAIAWMAVHSPRRGRIGPAALPAHVAQSTAPVAPTFDAARAEFERRYVRAALASANGHRVRAAKSLGVTRQGLAKMMKRLGIEIDGSSLSP